MITSLTNRNDYVGDGLTTVYAYSFFIFQNADLLVTKVSNATVPVETTLVLNTDYTMTGAANSGGGSITLTTALTSGYGLTLRRVVALKQLTDIGNQGDFYPRTHEDAFDHDAMKSQQLQDQLDRCLKSPETDYPDDELVLPSASERASKFLAFDADGVPVATDMSTTAATISAFGETLIDDANASAALTTLGVSTYAKTLLDDTTAAVARGTLGFAGASGTVTQSNLDGATISSSLELSNLTVTASVAASALTIAVKTLAGTDPTATDMVTAGFRSATITSGLYLRRQLSSALSLVISSGSTLGHASAIAHYIYVYLIDNAGTLELAASTAIFDEGSRVSTTAEGGAGAADSGAVMYSTVARTNVACRLVARLSSTQATAGTYATAIAEISMRPFRIQNPAAYYTTDTGVTATNATAVIINYEDKGYDTHNCVTIGAAWKYTANMAGKYRIAASVSLANQSGWEVNESAQIRVHKNGSHLMTIAFQVFQAAATAFCALTGSGTVDLAIGDYIDLRIYQDNDSGIATGASALTEWVTVDRIPEL